MSNVWIKTFPPLGMLVLFLVLAMNKPDPLEMQEIVILLAGLTIFPFVGVGLLFVASNSEGSIFFAPLILIGAGMVMSGVVYALKTISLYSSWQETLLLICFAVLWGMVIRTLFR